MSALSQNLRFLGSLLAVLGAFALAPLSLRARNPIIPNCGLTDPHVRIFNGRAYLFASHDRASDNKTFVMDDWWIWSSPDLVHWSLESVIKPEMTYIGKPFSGCWATDGAFRNGKCYFYFSEADQRCGVLVGDTPAGPWRDPLHRPLIDSNLPTKGYDMCVFQDDDGTPYITFGVWDYYIARLNSDMISLAEKPRKILIDRKFGPYGEGKLDDKSFLHKANGRYYLSWGCFYGTAENIYGPYAYKGAVLDKASFAPGYASPTWPNGFKQGRHGSFFEWHNQWYFSYCDMSQTGNRYFRDGFLSYVHYKSNGEMAPVRVDGIGVGEYQCDNAAIEAEDYFAAEGMRQQQNPDGGLVFTANSAAGHLIYPNIHGLTARRSISLRIATGTGPGRTVEFHEDSPDGRLLAALVVRDTGGAGHFQIVTQRFNSPPSSETLCIVIKAGSDQTVYLDSFTLAK